MWPNALAHVLPLRHDAGADAVLTLALLALGVLATTLVGLYVSNRAQHEPRRVSMLAALSAGALVLLLFDLLKESASLGQGLLQRPLLMTMLLAAYAAGLLLIPTLGKGEPIRVAWLWTLGIGLHGAAEGWIVGTEAGTSALAPTGVASFLLHKAIEAFTIPLVAFVTLTRRDLAGLPLVLALLALAGGVGGWLVGSGQAPLFLFAAGAGAATHALLRLARVIPGDLRHALVVLAGLLLVFAAGLLHEL